jgi:hypothetical protein
MEIRIHSVDVERYDLSTRMPFKYGIVTLTHLPHLFIRIEASVSGQRVRGITADHLPPKWFTKVPEKDPIEEIEDMLMVIEKAGQHAQTIACDSVFYFWHKLYQQQAVWATENHIPPLLAHFGTSLIERALIDAFCRYRKESFSDLLHANQFGISWDKLRPELAGFEVKDLLPPPLKTITVRHTVGMVDFLFENEISKEERINDGLPQSLQACIAFYGVNHFKIKVNGQLEQDMQRLESIEALFAQMKLEQFAFSLDGNEQFKDVDSLANFWIAIQSSKRMKSFFDHLLFIEQPFHRDIALTEEIGTALHSWEDAPPIIIDESDATLDTMPRALELGYRGTSHKNCKGVFKGILNRATINLRNRKAGNERYLMSGEDLGNIGPIANHQDLVVQACLGNESVERNGHHYFKGLSFFDRDIQSKALEKFSGIYSEDPSGYVRLNIRNGHLNMEDLLVAPFGTDQSHIRD